MRERIECRTSLGDDIKFGVAGCVEQGMREGDEKNDDIWDVGWGRRYRVNPPAKGTSKRVFRGNVNRARGGGGMWVVKPRPKPRAKTVWDVLAARGAACPASRKPAGRLLRRCKAIVDEREEFSGKWWWSFSERGTPMIDFRASC